LPGASSDARVTSIAQLQRGLASVDLDALARESSLLSSAREFEGVRQFGWDSGQSSGGEDAAMAWRREVSFTGFAPARKGN